MASHGDDDGSEDVADFLERIRDLSDQRVNEDAERARKLEEEILQGRKERQARRAERARSISPTKDSPLNSSFTSTHQHPESPTYRNMQPGRTRPEPPEKSPKLSSGPTVSPFPEPVKPVQPTEGANLSRSGTLSWQQRPGSRGSPNVRTRPLSVTGRSMGSPGEEAKTTPRSSNEASRDQVANMLQGKDPSWFRQTADRGKDSAAYRKTQDSATGSSESVRLHGLSGSSALTAKSPRPDGPARTPSPEHEVNQVNVGPAASAGVVSPMPVVASQRFRPREVEDIQGRSTSPSRNPAMSPSQGRISPERMDRPSSPTKGLGGFVQSAMMKRADSVSKRWSAQAAAGLSRGNSFSKSNEEATGRQQVSPSRESPSKSRIESQQEHGDLHAKHEDGSQAGLDVENANTSQNHSKRTSESKRWSPTKSTWLEAAINKSEPPKYKIAPPPQPSWMAEINKAKKARSEAESAKLAQDHLATGKDSDSKTQVSSGQSQDLPQSKGPTAESIPSPTSPSAVHNLTSDSQAQENPLQAESARDLTTASGFSGSKPNPTPSKPKPEAPPKKDFRGTLSPRPPPTSGTQNSEPEFKNVFGRLKKTETKNYKAPDELKDNITRGKAALNVTGGPRPYQKKDEFKDSILRKKQEMKAGTSVVNTGAIAAAAPSAIPEALAKRSSITSRPQPKETVAQSASATPNRAPAVARSVSSDVGTDEKPSAVERPIRSTPSRTSSSSSGSKLADRFNPNLAGILARGPPTGSTPPNPRKESTTEDSSLAKSDSASAVTLTHATKSRARGPKRRLPKQVAKDPSDTTTPTTVSQAQAVMATSTLSAANTTTRQTDLSSVQQKTTQDTKVPEPLPSPSTKKSPPNTKPKPLATGQRISSTQTANSGSSPRIGQRMSNSTSTEIHSSIDSSPELSSSSTVMPEHTQLPFSVSRAKESNVNANSKKEMSVPTATAEQRSPPAPAKKPVLLGRVSSGTAPAAQPVDFSTQEKKDTPPDSEVAVYLSQVFGQSLAAVAKEKFEADTQAILERIPEIERIKSLRKEIWEVTGDGKKISVPPQQEHILFDTSMFLCSHVFGAASGKRTTEVYLWYGNNVSSSAVEDAQLFGRNMAKEAGGKLIIIEQGKEPSRFFEALGGIVITRQGTPSSAANSRYMLCGRRHLGHVAFDEVSFTSKSLCSGFAYIVAALDGSKLFLWKGKGSGTDVVGCARLIAMDLGISGDIEELEEGAESIDFWKTLGASQIDHKAWYYPMEASWEKYATRLFAIDADARPKSGSGFLQWARRASTPALEEEPSLIRELSPFSQGDLSSDGVYVLDTFFELFVIVGSNAFTKLSSFHSAAYFAQEYSVLSASLEDRPFIPTGKVVLGGMPDAVKHAFRRWDDRRAPTARHEKILSLSEALEAFSAAA